MSDTNKSINRHVNADVDDNRIASDAKLHTPKGFKLAKDGEQFFRLDDNTPFYFPGLLPPALDIIDGNVAPTTEVDGDIYVLEDDQERDVDTLLFQAGNTIRVSFNDSFALPAIGDFIQIENATNAVNNGSFLVTGLPGGGAVDFTNPNRSDIVDDELSDSPATSKWTFADLDGAPPKSWVRFNNGLDLWIAVTPQQGNEFLNKTTGTKFFFDGIWNENLLDTAALLKTKSGVVAFGAFAGNPKIAAVVFAAPFADANYSVSIVGIDNRSWSLQAFGAAGFTINANANPALTANVYWIAIKHGEEP